MQSTYERKAAEAREIEGRILSGADRIVRAPNWVAWAKTCWPDKTDCALAVISGRDPRTARRWLSGEFEPPQAVWRAMLDKLFEGADERAQATGQGQPR